MRPIITIFIVIIFIFVTISLTALFVNSFKELEILEQKAQYELDMNNLNNEISNLNEEITDLGEQIEYLNVLIDSSNIDWDFNEYPHYTPSITFLQDKTDGTTSGTGTLTVTKISETGIDVGKVAVTSGTANWYVPSSGSSDIIAGCFWDNCTGTVKLTYDNTTLLGTWTF